MVRVLAYGRLFLDYDLLGGIVYFLCLSLMKFIDDSYLRAYGIFMMQIEQTDSVETFAEILKSCGKHKCLIDIENIISKKNKLEKIAVRVLLLSILGNRASLQYMPNGKPIICLQNPDNYQQRSNENSGNALFSEYVDVSISHGAGYVVVYVPLLSFVHDGRVPCCCKFDMTQWLGSVDISRLRLELPHNTIDARNSIGIDIESNERVIRDILIGRVIEAQEIVYVESGLMCSNPKLLVWCAKEVMFKARAACMESYANNSITAGSNARGEDYEFSYLRDLRLVGTDHNLLKGIAFGSNVSMRYSELRDKGLILVWSV